MVGLIIYLGLAFWLLEKSKLESIAVLMWFYPGALVYEALEYFGIYGETSGIISYLANAVFYFFVGSLIGGMIGKSRNCENIHR